jgi:hypothetical protein
MGPPGSGVVPGFPSHLPLHVPLPGINSLPALGGLPGFPGGLPGLPGLLGGLAPRQGLAQGLPSRAMILKNMFDPAEETEEGWDLDIAEDVKEECEKHGPVLHIAVQKDTSGLVFVLFRCVACAHARAVAVCLRTGLCVRVGRAVCTRSCGHARDVRLPCALTPSRVPPPPASHLLLGPCPQPSPPPPRSALMDAVNASSALAGRVFAGKAIEVQFIHESEYQSKFPSVLV